MNSTRGCWAVSDKKVGTTMIPQFHWASNRNLALLSLGVKRYILVMIQHFSQYLVHDRISSMIHLLFLAGNRDLQSRHVIRNTAFYLLLLHSQWSCAVGTTMVASSEFQVECVEFPRFIGIYWLFSVSISCSFLVIAIVSYRIIILLSVSWYVLPAEINRCTGNTMNHFITSYHWICCCIAPVQ